MSTLLCSRRLWGLGLAFLGLTVFAGSGCSGRPENSPVVRKKFQEMATLQEQVGNLDIQMKQIAAEMTAVRKDVGDVRSLSGGGEAVSRIEQMDTRLQTLEQELTKINEAIGTGIKAREVASAQPKESSSDKEKSEPAAKSSSSSSSKSLASASKSHKASSDVPTRQFSQATTPKPRGQYYSIRSGDTPASIARQQGIDLDTLLRANRLPKDATLFPGQKVYVPAPR